MWVKGFCLNPSQKSNTTEEVKVTLQGHWPSGFKPSLGREVHECKASGSDAENATKCQSSPVAHAVCTRLLQWQWGQRLAPTTGLTLLVHWDIHRALLFCSKIRIFSLVLYNLPSRQNCVSKLIESILKQDQSCGNLN